MDAVEFLINLGKHCKDRDCKECNIYEECDYMYIGTTRQQAKTMVNFIEQWAKEHSIKTRQSEFLKMFPDARTAQNGALSVPPCKIDKYFDENQSCNETRCNDCRYNYWLQEVE